ncbi:nuclear transport factor 2 family protein [Pseudohalioglobus sediminis]|uniref:Nuclear transport factor 2 family protein n=1 Tax=Pseudohalioglobus sediminis TaxID=2606449 RepID=A0A5B0WZ83_9GAMM|nr:nuclear transport factor 2 family protein [Pseudohalioglobus sediminis]KAA1192380.1 nuclear transport factor 2 family protein [Pseudohalioglobus sediminis]
MAQSQKAVEQLLVRLDELESRIAIRDLASDYCHGFDKRDYDRFLAIWWPDCTWNIGPPFGSFEGHEGIHTAVHEVLWPAWQESHHLTTNHVIQFGGADSATAICDVDCVGTLVGEEVCQIVGATYRDTLQRREGIWKILERGVTIHYFNPVPGTRLVPPATS